ncbi:thrombospondin type-1 domain-containing protein 4-like [Sphaerodactylus townsendi]|uniref:thrombospondin type-1 domain-containing protein 4-like n=1 Tax=Sphaerodactylus townsendi TaxID=933632 RepID=UPI00202655BC|nr:thrombospondin type-1 domain-containing protein 4-like [Sphaerodactylus townsendi]
MQQPLSDKATPGSQLGFTAAQQDRPPAVITLLWFFPLLVKGSQKCELNCRAVGYRFYVRQAETVIDGTPCDQNGTSICVSGQCKSIGCDDYLGSDKVVDKCGICGGDNTACNVVSGIFQHPLTNLGYHKIVEIPEGATKINVTEMSKSNNYLAHVNCYQTSPVTALVRQVELREF